MLKKHLPILLLAHFLPTASFAKGYEKCSIPEKWILSVVKANGGSTIEADKIPKKVLKEIDPKCMDDIGDAIYKEKLDYTQITAAVKKAQKGLSKNQYMPRETCVDRSEQK